MDPISFLLVKKKRRRRFPLITKMLFRIMGSWIKTTWGGGYSKEDGMKQVGWLLSVTHKQITLILLSSV